MSIFVDIILSLYKHFIISVYYYNSLLVYDDIGTPLCDYFLRL